MGNNEILCVPKSYLNMLSELQFIDNKNISNDNFTNYYENFQNGKKDKSIKYYNFIERLILLVSKSIEVGIISTYKNLQFKRFFN